MTAQATVTFEADLLIWGASLWGDSDPATITAEYGDHYWPPGPLFDHKGRPSGTLNDGPIPYYYALPWTRVARAKEAKREGEK